ncbi:MAG: hypothetical protein KF729_08655 [Sandaracinaceae bacterium]|nr:hypothetical protein [Sandaracinaceae bacterium]
MGLLETRWEAQHQGHRIVVFRNELTKGFSLEWDGEELARRRWSWIGLGTLAGTAEVDGEPVEVHVELDWGGDGLNGTCTITVGGQRVTASRVR